MFANGFDNKLKIKTEESESFVRNKKSNYLHIQTEDKQLDISST